MQPRGMGEFPSPPRDFFGIFTPYRYDDGTALMPVVNNQEQLPVPFVATHQEELSLPVIVTHQSQLPLHVTVTPGGEQRMPLHVLVTPDRHQPSLPGVIGTTQDVFGDGQRYHINSVVITPQDRNPLPDPNWQDQGPVIISRKGELPPRAFVPYPAQDLTVYTTDREKLLLPVHVRYRFLAPDESRTLPSDWYSISFRLHYGCIWLTKLSGT